MSSFEKGARVQRTDDPEWGPGTVDFVSDDEGTARVLFAGGFVVAWVPLLHLAPWPVSTPPDSESDAERLVKRVEQVYDDAQVSAREFLRDNAVPDSGEGDRG